MTTPADTTTTTHLAADLGFWPITATRYLLSSPQGKARLLVAAHEQALAENVWRDHLPTCEVCA